MTELNQLTQFSATESFVDDYYFTEISDKKLPLNRYLDRELSWLAFNRRILEMASDPTIPLLEQCNYSAIFASNLDEFFMVRVAGLKSRLKAGIAVQTLPELSPHEVLNQISELAHTLMAEHARIAGHLLNVALPEVGIEIKKWWDLDEASKGELSNYFHDQVFAVLTPLAVDPAHPFPYISGLSLNLSVRVKNPKSGKEQFARLKVPQILSRLVPVLHDVPAGVHRFILLEDLIAAHLEDLFPGMEILEYSFFRITRNQDVQIDGHDSDNLIKALEKELRKRRFGPPIRLEVSDRMDPTTQRLLVAELKVTDQEIYPLTNPLDLSVLYELNQLDRPELKFRVHVPSTADAFRPQENMTKPDVFSSIQKNEVLVHHPYQSFATSVQTFLEAAAQDPKVFAIKQTLYRTSGDSPIVEALIDAANAGKQVLALVEIKARFDERANIIWARKLEEAGVHVVYGMVGLKTHCKLALVIRQEEGELRTYSHIGTGNYNPKTSRIYEDLGLFTADPGVGKEVNRLFNELSGYAIEKKFKRLLVAPLHLRKGLLKRIKGEIENAEAGLPSGIQIKVNSIVDEEIIDALYLASRAGVPVEIWVRGICSVRPGMENLSENIRVRSIIGRNLEHSRIYAFHNNGNLQTYIGSADLMHRNLDRRVETLIRIQDETHLKYIDFLFKEAFAADADAWDLTADGDWVRHPEIGDPRRHLHDTLMERYRP